MGAVSLREIAFVALFAALACGAHVLVFYGVLRGAKAAWARVKRFLQLAD